MLELTITYCSVQFSDLFSVTSVQRFTIIAIYSNAGQLVCFSLYGIELFATIPRTYFFDGFVITYIVQVYTMSKKVATIRVCS